MFAFTLAQIWMIEILSDMEDSLTEEFVEVDLAEQDFLHLLMQLLSITEQMPVLVPQVFKLKSHA